MTSKELIQFYIDQIRIENEKIELVNAELLAKKRRDKILNRLIELNIAILEYLEIKNG